MPTAPTAAEDGGLSTHVLHMTRLHAKRPFLVELRVINGPFEKVDVGFRVAGGAWLACNTSVAGWEESKDLSSKAPRRGKKCADFMRSDQENPPETGTPGKPASRCSVQSTVGKINLLLLQ